MNEKELATFLGPLADEYDPEEDRITVQPPETQTYPPLEFQNPTVQYDSEKEEISVMLNRNHENFGAQFRAIAKAVEEIRQKFGLWSRQERVGENLLFTFQFPPTRKND
ncbi:MAG TPA: hypothetical protein PKA32_02475 [Candidatus Gracilibacteria bacterium]|nr:hypothetical protein [Candidatus Gracilibacteria bacterium]